MEDLCFWEFTPILSALGSSVHGNLTVRRVALATTSRPFRGLGIHVCVTPDMWDAAGSLILHSKGSKPRLRLPLDLRICAPSRRSQVFEESGHGLASPARCRVGMRLGNREACSRRLLSQVLQRSTTFTTVPILTFGSSYTRGRCRWADPASLLVAKPVGAVGVRPWSLNVLAP